MFARALIRALRLIALYACACAAPASAQLRVDLITVEPGEALWERFGHTAVRVYGGELDTVYNFGSAPFFDPGFLWKFVRGEGEFMVVAEPYATTLARYRSADRTLLQQRLLLPNERLLELALRLQIAAQAPNNRYLYDQLYDNCATRVRDLINRVSKGALARAASRQRQRHRYRDDTLAAMAGHPIGHWALDLIGGRQQDLPVAGFNEMYLPLALRDRVSEAHFMADGHTGPLAAPADVVFRRRGPALSRATQAARVVMLLLALALASLALAFMRSRGGAKRRISALSASLLWLWSGLFGTLVVPLTLYSHVHNFSPNENAWLFWPSDLLLAPFLGLAIARERGAGPVLKLYLALKLLSLSVLLASKLVGLCVQQNAVFVCLAALFALPLAALVWPGLRLARAFASR